MSAYEQIGSVEAAREGGWELTLYSDRTQDEAPHRGLLERLAASHPQMRLTLPRAEPNEDCVDGHLEWGMFKVSLYFEATVLSYLSLWSPDREAIEALRQLIIPAVRLT